MTEGASGAIVPFEEIEGMIKQLRRNVDACDEALCALLLARQKYSLSIRRMKKRIEQPDVDLGRERDIVGYYVSKLGRPIGYEVSNAVLHHSKGLGV